MIQYVSSWCDFDTSIDLIAISLAHFIPSNMSPTIQTLTKKLVNNPNSFTPADAQTAIVELMAGRATSAQIASFLIALKLQNKDAEPEMVAACAASMLEFAVNVDFSQ